MQNMEQKNSENRMLTDEELNAVDGGAGFWEKVFSVVRSIFNGPGDLGRPTRPLELTSSSGLPPAAVAAIAGGRSRYLAEAGAFS